jgi:ABC-type glycerol-3-phosphate transport system substrate-binding protein
MKTIKKTALAAIMLAGLILTPAIAQQDVTISMWTHDPLYIRFFLERAAEWEKQYPQYNFTYDFLHKADALMALQTAIAGGLPLPDLFGIELGMMGPLMRDGLIARYFVDLTDRIADRRHEFIEGRLSIYMYEGGLYGLESALTASVYYYQPALFEAHGVEVPTTWEEFLEVGEVLGQHGVALSVMAPDPNGPFTMFLLQRGAQIFDEHGNFVLGEEPNRQMALEVLNLIRQGIDNGAFYTIGAGEFWGMTIPTALRTGRMAGIIMPEWYSGCCLKPTLEDMAGQWRVAPMPVWGDGVGHTTTTWGGTGFAISAQSPHLELVWSLLEHAYGTLDGQLTRFEAIGFYPTMYEALRHPRVTELSDPFYGGQQISRVTADVALDMPVQYQSPHFGAYLTAVFDNLPLFFDGTYTAEQFLDKVIHFTEAEILLVE